MTLESAWSRGAGIIAGLACVALPLACDSAPAPLREPDRFESRPIPLSCVSFGPRPGLAKAVPAYPALSFYGAVHVVADPGTQTVFVAETPGTIRRFADRPDVASSDLVADLRGVVVRANVEDGLLGLAPERGESGAIESLVVKYTTKPSSNAYKSRLVVARIRSRDGGATFAADSLEEILSIDSPGGVHYGGPPAFGTDGLLYVPTGDGGFGFADSASDLGGLRGKVLRIDVRGRSGYTVPAQNPFVGRAGARGEIFAYGFRNPFGWVFDTESDALWVGDVGEFRFEELSHVTAGANLGWPRREGPTCVIEPCVDGDSILPVFSYPHAGAAAIVGGPVYRGARFPELLGRVIVGDYVGGRIDAISRTRGGEDIAHVDETGLPIISFAENARGEILFSDGLVLHELDRRQGGTRLPALLSRTGCVDLKTPLEAPKGFIPYRIGMPLWSDGTEKARWIALPEGSTMKVLDDGSLEAPVGTVAVKSFFWHDKPLETRLLVRHSDGEWAGYSYAWRDDGKEADLLEYGGKKELPDLSWTFPTDSLCMGCHTKAAARTLGLEIAQLNRRITVAGERVSQLEVFEKLGIVQGPLPPMPLLPRFPRREDANAPPDEWARAYLHANCSHCHRPEGPGYGKMSFLFTAAPGDEGCDVEPSSADLGVPDARIVAPGSPDRSLVVQRMLSLDEARRMPPTGTKKVDDLAVGVLRRWIGDLKTCH